MIRGASGTPWAVVRGERVCGEPPHHRLILMPCLTARRGRLTCEPRRTTLRQSLQMLRDQPFVGATSGKGDRMHVREGMSSMVLTVGPGHTLRAVARLMSERGVGAAVVIDPEAGGPGIITERDILTSI